MPRKTPVNRSKILKWRLEWLAQLAFERLASLLSGPAVFRVGETLGDLAWRLMRSRRQIVLRNLRIAFYGEHELPALESMVRQIFRRTGANLFSALHTAKLNVDQVDRIVSVDNPEVAQEAFQQSRGLITLPSHMGNWEVLTRIKRKFPPGHQIGAFYRPLNNPYLNQRIVAQREAEGSRLFSKFESFHQATTFVKEGGVLGILADQRTGLSGKPIPFFGRLTRVSPLPSLLARRSKTEVLAMSLTTDSPGKWRLRYHPVEDRASTASCMKSIEEAMKVSPIDVFWMQERWRVMVRPRRTIREWLGEDSPCGEKPHRALLWLAGAPESWKLSENWTHPDVNYEFVLAPGQPSPDWLPADAVIHHTPTGGTMKSFAREIFRIDRAHPLPIDYILTSRAPEPLVKAAKSQSISIVSLRSKT
ncbi:hypothetical protein JIN85_08740 [Luteolibacter pohnpeiensis]|uniref:Lipid A biosynthesis lauroyl acyltransferase n=1 Tax=Luteolibacter pohnpeiensis TaxID=454153 RepID=A0A934VVS0_9BACT|nr:hypothetical protein [Luteolibacter pohnpeiensis]MBK1882500.1 hypothetical protein [Luteolibacter pohnpeiensis]